MGQLRQAAKDVGIKINHTPAEPEQIHQAILAGLLSHIGLKDTGRREYSARATRASRSGPAAASRASRRG